MPDFEKIISYIELTLKLIFGDQVPAWIFRLVGYILLVALILLGIWGLLLILSKIKNLWTEHFWPLFYNPEEKRRSSRRRRFADHIESEIRRLNNLEEWRDYRFAELEAEVEAEGRRRAFGIFPFFQRTRSGLRREKSLSKALESSQERLLLLEGEPGSGKSVALRHVAQSMARRAMKARSTKSVIPIYINLKELKRRRGEAVDRNLIYSFVLKSLNRANDRDIEEFLEEEFDRGLQEGTWLFLFDSFDELPEVLRSTEADKTIRGYADAISDFLHGMNQCRGIIASRQFRGPGQFGWPRFRILPLSEARCSKLVHKADLKPESERDLMGQLGMARQEIRAMTRNPMFLGLLCEHMRAGHPFPKNVHSVFESYVETRLTRDEERLWRRFKLKPTEVRAAAESLAFCMAVDPGLGLSPTRENLEDATERLGLWVGKRSDTLLDALEYIKLARSETATAAGESKPFTFAHRRFQEYFATCVVLREPERVSPRQLLTDARWRETAVAMCQTQPLRVLSPILKEARSLLAEMVNSIPGLIDEPLEYVRASESTDHDKGSEDESLPEPFPWPSGALHILGLLQDGLGSRLKELPDDIRLHAGRLVLSASGTGMLSDKKWGLEMAGIVPQPILLHMLRDAFASPSQWLREVAYRQAARLGEIPVDIAGSIRRALVSLATDDRLLRERHATHAHLARLDKSAHFLSVARLLLWVPFVDLGLHILTIAFFVLRIQSIHESLFTPTRVAIIVLLLISLLSFRRASRPIWWLIYFLIRLFFTMFFFSIVLWWSGEISSTQLLYSLLFGYVAIWVPLARLSSRAGQFTHPLWWPLMPILPLLYPVRNVKEISTTVLSWIREYWIVAAVGVVLSILSAFSAAPVSLLLAIEVILVALLFVLILVAGVIAAVRWIQDWFRWRKWVRSHQTSMPAQELLEMIGQYHRRTFHNRLVRTIREQGLLVATEGTETLLNRLATAIEHAMLLRKKTFKESLKRWWSVRHIKLLLTDYKRYVVGLKTRPKRVEYLSPERTRSMLPASDFFDLWYAEHTEKDEQRLSILGPEFLDEICMLLEQVRASRRDRG